MLNALIVDDEPLAHQVILHHLKSHSDINIIGHCYNAKETLTFLSKSKIDLLFLDINMPALNGIDLLRVLDKPPQVIIISAYQEYAIQGFELNVTDYLLKPVSEHRFSQALDKVRSKDKPQDSISSTSLLNQQIVLKVNREKCKFILDDIDFLEAYGNYVKVWQNNTMLLASSSLKKVIELLPATQFTQVHKSFVVNNQKIKSVDRASLKLSDGTEIKIGKSYKLEAQKILMID